MRTSSTDSGANPPSANPAEGALNHRLEERPDRPVLHLAGHLTRHHTRALDAMISVHTRSGKLVVDLSRVVSMDSAAVATLITGWRRAQLGGGQLEVGPLSEAARNALSMFRLKAEVEPGPTPPTFFEAVGGGAYGGRAALRQFVDLFFECIFAIGSAIRRPRTLRWGAFVEQCIYIGSQALPIVALICFLIGLVMAFQSAYQLRQFGADIFVADLTGVAMVREMGPLMTAILVAGRSGSSIAAEISTMKVSEEIDALEVMGLDPIKFLAVPRLLAITLTVPLLTLIADLVGIFGGFLVGVVYLDIAWNAFLNQTIAALDAMDVVNGFIKSAAFAFGIGLIGLHYGFRVSGGAGEVGRTTTSSVVTAIFYIIVADSAFSILFYVVLA